MTTEAAGVDAPNWKIIAALITVYVVWGSTYLAIRIAIETLPPFLMAGTRFAIAGALLYAWRRVRGAPRPTLKQWKAATAVGALLLLGGNGGVVWAEQWVESGRAALVVATVPFWMVLLDRIRPGGSRPSVAVWIGVAVGLAGVALLAGGSSGVSYRFGLIVLLIASVAWAAGSLYSRTAILPTALTATGMEMLTGGILLLAFGIAMGELGEGTMAVVSLRSALALLYLIVFGSLLGFTCYVWLLRVASAGLVSTYAYVNPVVAVFLGWLIASEPLSPRVIAASAVIIGSVVLITTAQATRRARLPPAAEVPGSAGQ